MKIRPTRLGLPALAALLLLVSGCDADEPGAHRIVPKDQGRLQAAERRGTPEGMGEHGPVERGEALFRGKGVCSACHGPDGEGTQIAPDLTDDEWLHIEEPVTVEKIAELIMNGVLDPLNHPGIMPPRGGGALSDDEVEVIASYVLALRH